MKIKYVGSLPTGFVPDMITGAQYAFKKGVPLEVPDELGARLVKQSIWRKSSEQKQTEKENKT